MTKIVYGLVGFGARGQALAAAAVKTGLISIGAICDSRSDIQSLAEQEYPEAVFYSDYGRMLESGLVDVVVIATPNDLHYALAKGALEKGYHVFCEKPVAFSDKEVLDLQALVERQGKIFHVGVELRYSPMMNYAKSLLDSDTIGRPQLLWCRELRPPFWPGEEDWRLGPRSGGSLLEKNIHHFDLFNWFFGCRPVQVSAIGGADVVYQKEKVLDNAIVDIEYESGQRASLILGLFYQAAFSLELGFLGAKGRIDMEVPPERLTLTTEAFREVREFSRTPIRGRFDHEGEVEQHLALASALQGQGQTFSTLQGVRDAHQIAFAAEQSIAEGRKISL